MMKYPCGCVNDYDSGTGILKSVSKCARHRSKAGLGGLAYYESLGTVSEGRPLPTAHERELLEALPSAVPLFYERNSGATALEIGCGTSVYMTPLLRGGYQYLGIDLDREAVEWTAKTYGVKTICQRFEDAIFDGNFDLILSAHCLEHFADAPAMVRKIFDLLKPGGNLLLVIPDDSDPVNPDHLWFFRESDIRRLLDRSGFVDSLTAVRKYVAHENFIYCHARKP